MIIFMCVSVGLVFYALIKCCQDEDSKGEQQSNGRDQKGNEETDDQGHSKQGDDNVHRDLEMGLLQSKKFGPLFQQCKHTS